MRTRLVLLGLAFALPISADDWPSWRGADRTGVSKEKGLLQTWPKDGPALAWTFEDAGRGYSTPAVVGDRLYLTGARDDDEYLFCLNIKTPKGAAATPNELWKVKIGPRFTWKNNNWNSGPSGTPTVDGDRVYALGGFGTLVCVGAEDGKEVWRKDLPKEMGAEVNPFFGGLEKPTPLGWGFTWSPLIDGDNLIITPGGKKGLFAALEKKTGKVVWQSKEIAEQATYSSPVVAEVGGKKFFVALFQQGLAAVTPDGKTALHHKREKEFGDVVIPTPVAADGHVFVTVAGEEKKGCVLFKLTADGDKLKAEEVYTQSVISNYIGGTVKVGDHVYGYSQPRSWACVEFKTGKVAWEAPGMEVKLNQGSVISADGMLYCFDERAGVCALVKASPKEYEEAGRLTLPKKSKLNQPSGRLWTPPVVANGKLYLRDQDLLFCYDVKAAK